MAQASYQVESSEETGLSVPKLGTQLHTHYFHVEELVEAVYEPPVVDIVHVPVVQHQMELVQDHVEGWLECSEDLAPDVHEHPTIML